jgi:hypothetical protein
MDVADMSTNLLTARDVAALLGCSLERVRRYRADGVLSAFYVGTQPVFRRFDVESLGAQNAVSSRSTGRRVAFGAGVRGQRVVQALLCDTTEFVQRAPHST